MRHYNQNLPLNPLRTFAAASRHATFSAAARELGVTQVAVSRQVAVVEDYFDTQLFERHPQQNKLTEAGRTLSRQLAPLFDELENAAAEFLDKERRQIINLRAYPTFAYGWLVPRLATFHAMHPNFEMRFDTTVEPLDFRGTYLDVAIQLGQGKWPGTRARELFVEEIDAVCNPDYAEVVSRRQGGEFTLEGLTVLHSKYRRREWTDWAERQGTAIDGLQSYEFQSSLLTYRAAKSGLGLAMAQLALIEEELTAGDLVRPFQKPVKTGNAFWIIWPSDHSVNLMTKLFIDWVLIGVGRKPEFFPQSGASLTGT